MRNMGENRSDREDNSTRSFRTAAYSLSWPGMDGNKRVCPSCVVLHPWVIDNVNSNIIFLS